MTNVLYLGEGRERYAAACCVPLLGWEVVYLVLEIELDSRASHDKLKHIEHHCGIWKL